MLAVRPALEHPNVTLRAKRMATKLTTNPAGTAVTGVEVLSQRAAANSYQGDIVVVSCGAANSAKLLLMSANDKHPRGLANGSDQVGRNYMFHNSQAVLALSKEPNPTQVPEDARTQRLLLRHGGFRVPDGQYPDGRQIAGADVPRREADRDGARATYGHWR